jgi:hypothetical protein
MLYGIHSFLPMPLAHKQPQSETQKWKSWCQILAISINSTNNETGSESIFVFLSFSPLKRAAPFALKIQAPTLLQTKAFYRFRNSMPHLI